ncbi:TetR/AcrR family transcriptional regulator [Actinomadura rupiterrae]|uniref:TetR/AcrR family transcriptional regulator n=1 Tax=Actinomadura rupiterrae TaxID=559627 RepID=UPI0027E2CF4C|nr:helix-turn-helix domain-containing protein [Actinomadura rupiterrae]MCP2336582.1 AcrR family transcriptional regulator [Actinomadura rupiterrae]
MSANGERLRDPQQRAERATRILDAAADLLLRHGYRRVTIDDVAAEASIGKGTVYLHWKTREQLFRTVFAREVVHAIDELRDAIEQDPTTCLPHRFASTYFTAITNRPLLRRFLLGDPDLLGKLTSSPDTDRDTRHAQVSQSYFQLLAKHHLLRDDLTPAELAYAYQATFEGFLRAEAAPAAPNPARQASLLAQTVQRAFERETPPPAKAVAEVAAATATLLTTLTTADRKDFALPSPNPPA